MKAQDKKQDMKLADRIQEFVGKPFSVLCARYWYRGVLAEVGEDYILLQNPFAVEVTGASTSNEARQEDAIPSDLIISLFAVEQICWPTWVFKGYTSDTPKKLGKKKGKNT